MGELFAKEHAVALSTYIQTTLVLSLLDIENDRF